MTPHKFSRQILYEDNHLLIVNKQRGYLVQGGITGDKPLVEYYKEYVKEKYNKPGNVFLGVVHRLDRPVSGVLAFARTSKALQRMNDLFRKQEVDKIYWAIVGKVPPAIDGRLTHWLVKDKKKNIVKALDGPYKQAKRASLNYRLLGNAREHYLLEVKPLTGRAHQIRVQLAAMGCPIRGDVKYGYPEPNKDANINLHAKFLGFEHPVKKEPLYISAPLPEDEFWKQFKNFDQGITKTH